MSYFSWILMRNKFKQLYFRKYFPKSITDSSELVNLIKTGKITTSVGEKLEKREYLFICSFVGGIANGYRHYGEQYWSILKKT